jgi:hypothetical protein
MSVGTNCIRPKFHDFIAFTTILTKKGRMQFDPTDFYKTSQLSLCIVFKNPPIQISRPVPSKFLSVKKGNIDKSMLPFSICN